MTCLCSPWLCAGGGRRKQRGEKGGHHFHHVRRCLPRPVFGFSLLRLLQPRFSLLSCVVIPPVLFLAVLALAVSFVWLTLLYFVAPLLSKDSSHESFKNGGTGRAGEIDKHHREEDDEEGKVEMKAMEHVAEELAGHSATAEVCVQRLEIKEVRGYGFSEESHKISKMASSESCTNYEVHTDDKKPVEEEIILKINREELHSNARFDGFSDRHRVQDLPIDWFVEVLNIKEVSTSGDSFPIVLSISSAEIHDFPDMNEVVGLSVTFLVEDKQNMVFQSNNLCHHNNVDYRKEFLACTSSEIVEFIDEYEIGQVVLDGCANDDKIVLLTSRDGSTHDGIRDEHKEENTEEKGAKSVLELPIDCVANMEVFGEQQDKQKVVVHDNSKLPESLFIKVNRKQIVGTANEVTDFIKENETSVFSLGSVCEDKIGAAASSHAWSHNCIGDEEYKHKELIEKNIEKASVVATVVCDFSENHRTTRAAADGFGNDKSTGEVGASLESSVLERTGDKDEKINDDYTSEGVSRRLPLIRRSSAQWWNLCGLLDVFAGCKD